MRSAVPTRFLVVSLVTAVLSGLFALAPVSASASEHSSPCAHERWPPAPVDTSEEPPPGLPSPAPPPVPATPAGGERMAECGIVLPRGESAPQVPKTLSAWLLQDLETGEVLAAKNPHSRHRPASLIKTLLALVVLEELPLDRVVVATKQDANQECTCAGIVAGGRYEVGELLDALLMRSGNDVAHTLATALGGFKVAVGKMNDLAARLGAADTQAATPSGLDGPGMTTSVYDMSLVFREAMRKPRYVEAVSKQHIEFPGGPGKPDIPIYNDNALWDIYPGFLGGKTGFTDDARHTYAGAAERDGNRIAVVMLRGEQRPIRMSEQATRLLDYGFELKARGAEPVGVIENAARSQPQEPRTTEAAEATPAGRPEGAAAGPTGATATSEEDQFGTTGWIITLVLSLAIGIGLVLAHRKGLIHRAE